MKGQLSPDHARYAHSLASFDHARGEPRITCARHALAAEYPAGSALAERKISDCEVVWILRGSACVVRPDRPDLVMGPGDVLLLDAGFAHSFQWDPLVTTRHGYLHFTWLGEGSLLAPGAAGALLRNRLEAGPVLALCDYLLWLGTTSMADGTADARRDHVMGLLADLLCAGPLPALRNDGADPLDRLFRYINNAWSDGPTRRLPVAELAASASMSPASLTRLFRARFGVSPASALEAARLDRAAALLTHTSLTLEGVARSCGYASAAHLSHRFRRVVGFSPGAARHRGRPELPWAGSATGRFVAELWLGLDKMHDP